MHPRDQLATGALVEVPVPQGERGGAAARLEIARLQDELWALIRDEASAAEREMTDA